MVSPSVVFVLSDPDYTTADRVAKSINGSLGSVRARPTDASSIEIQLAGIDPYEVVGFLTKIENLQVEPDQRAKVVVNERTGTVVSGGDVRIVS